jgi:hypothetical protein
VPDGWVSGVQRRVSRRAVCPEFDTRSRLSASSGVITCEKLRPSAACTGVTKLDMSLAAMFSASAAYTSAIGSNAITLPVGPVHPTRKTRQLNQVR